MAGRNPSTRSASSTSCAPGDRASGTRSVPRAHSERRDVHAKPSPFAAMMRSVLAVLAGYLTFAVTGGLLFAVTGVDPHASPTPLVAVGTIVYGMVFAALGGWLAAAVSRDASD